MRTSLIVAPMLGILSGMLTAQEVVKLPASSQPSVTRPDDLFRLPPGTWYFGRALWKDDSPCDEKTCEAGFNSGDLVVSAERSGKFVRVIAGLKNCESVGFSEIEAGDKPGKYTRGKVADLVSKVTKGLSQTCKVQTPEVPRLEAVHLFARK